MLRIFPVAASGAPKYSDDFGVPRRAGSGTHEGIDIFAAEGTPIFAVQDGAVRRWENSPTGGNEIYLTGVDGRHYFYSHCQSFEGPFPRAVQAGDVIGRVGTTGNAAGGPPHLHFQIHEATGHVVNPFPELLGFLPVDSPRALPRSPAALNSAAGFGVVVLLLLLLSSRR